MRRVLSVAAVALALVACQRLSEETPAGASKPTGSPSTPSSPVVVTPIGLPSPTSPGPAPNPTPTPSTGGGDTQPTPAPTAPPAQTQGCSLPAGTGSGNNCPRQSPSFLSKVEKAIDMTVAQYPNAFNLKDGGPCGNCYYVRDAATYEAGVVRNLQSQGLCARFDGEEFAVKNSNQFNDQYDLMTSDMHIRRQEGSYRSTCYPASF